ncbi:hypothetical protein OPU71_14235 [Niveibacterium sp. 24ML]|uniref:hypothetical protein n=1 Tax=Niveibacterium sp. 24ML TaxID=2985512 RepID=UPI00226EBC91|nr:hypothetical protein [Niveibacterium sp. 24ML]MCX9157283.1 hypothetical protein [Niveibacterium sp. 24ML]
MDPTGNHLSSIDLARIDVNQLEEALAGLHKFSRVTKKEMVRRQLAAIESARERGVGYAAIAAAFSASGCAIDARVLRKYVHQLRRAADRLPAHGDAETGGLGKTNSEPPTRGRATAPLSKDAGPAPRRSLSRSALVAASNPSNAT